MINQISHAKTFKEEGVIIKNRFYLWKSLGFLSMLIFVVMLGTSMSFATSSKKILILHSDEEFIPANIEINKYLIEELRRTAKEPITFYSEYLDTIRFTTPEDFSEFQQTLIKRYSTINPDIIVAIDYKAYLFAAESLTKDQPNRPIVFCMLPKSLFDSQKVPANATGSFMNIDIIGTLDIIKKIHPQVEKVSIIAGDGPSDESKVKEVSDRLKAHNGYPFSIEFVRNKSISEFETFAATRTNSEILVYLSIFEDRLGKQFIPREALAKLDKVTTVPIYGLFYSNMDSGLVGGSLFEFKRVALDAASRCVALLSGQTPHSLTPEYVTNKSYLNYPMLKRWQISESKVPEGVELYKQTFTPWQLYQKEIAIVFIVIALFIVLTVILVVQLRLKKSAEQALKELNAKLEHLVDERTGDLLQKNIELKEAHQKIIQSEKQTLIQNLSRNLLHKINTPLGVSISYIDLMRSLVESDEKQFDNEDLKGEEGILTRLMTNQLRIKSIMESLERTLHIEQSPEKSRIHLEEVLRLGVLERQSIQMTQSDVLNLRYTNAEVWINEKSFVAALQCLTDYAHTSVKSYSKASELSLSIEDSSLVLIFKSDSFAQLENIKSIFEPYTLLPFKNDDSGLELTIFNSIITLGLSGTVALIQETTSEEDFGVAIKAVIPVELSTKI